jgi:signal transduction histidine kinase
VRDRTSTDFDAFRRQESTLIVANVTVVAVLLLVHVSFASILGAPNRPLLFTLTAFLLFLVAELVWLRAARSAPAPRAIRAYSVASVWVALGFVTLATFVGDVEDRHYSALMVLPLLSAAFRFSLPGTLGVAAIASGLNFLEVHYFYQRHLPVHVTEYFEAFGVSLILCLVAAVVWLLANDLREEQSKLFRSLAELEKTRDKLVAEEKLAVVGRLAGAIAHEIRNPVAMIASSLASAVDGALPEDRREEMFRIAAAEARRLEALTSEFLSYARTRPPEKKPIAVAALLGYVADLVRARAESSGRRVEIHCPDSWIAVIDLFQFQQALLNLAINALDAARPGGRIVLGAGPGGGHGLELFVENDGAAIDPETSARIFEPFFTTKPGGTGLGLAIARNIARAHGGEVLLSVNEPGRVRFALSLPSDALAGPLPAGMDDDGPNSPC